MGKLINKFLFTKEENIMREGAWWNAIFSGLNAIQSVVFLFFITRLCGEEAAGIFTIAFSIAYLMIMIGNYGVRNYQATDIKDRFCFRDYLLHRIISCVAMMICSGIYVFIMHYTREKTAVVIGFCFLKMVESFEDVYHGLYQQKGRLDVASKIGAVRYIFTILTFVAALVIKHNLIIAVYAAVAVSVVVLAALILYTYPRIVLKKESAGEKLCWNLFFVCFPLFAAGFLNMYISNASKYAIDRNLTDTVQGYYGMIFMPVFVIHLLSSFIYRPYLVDMAKWWREKEIDKLKRFIGKQLAVIGGICGVVVIGGYFLGITLLSIFYGTDLTVYRNELAILLIGGGMAAIIEFMNNIITVIRKQNNMLWIYGIVFLISLFVTDYAVQAFAITGAAISYTVIFGIQAVMMLIYVFVQIKKK